MPRQSLLLIGGAVVMTAMVVGAMLVSADQRRASAPPGPQERPHAGADEGRSDRRAQGAPAAPAPGAAARAVPVAARASDTDWPRFRGPDGGGASAETGLPVEWSATKNIAWKVPLPGRGASSPIIRGDHVYVTCYSGYGFDVESPGDKSKLVRHLVCVHRKTGRILWTKEKPLATSVADYNSVHTIGRHGYASSTPVADEHGVYVFYEADGVIAYTHDGAVRWTAPCGDKTHEWGSASSPIIHGDLLIVHASVQCGALLALDRHSGEEVWRVQGLLPKFWTPLVVKEDGREALLHPGNYDFQVAAVDPRSGERLWTVKTDIGAINGSPIQVGDTIILVGKNARSCAVRLGGSGDVSSTHIAWSRNKGAYITSPVYHDGHIYWSRDGGVAYCVNARTGELMYEARMDGYVYASPLIADGKLYYVTRERGVYVLPARPRFEVLAHNKIETDKSVFNGSPAVSDGSIYLRSDAALYCIRAGSL